MCPVLYHEYRSVWRARRGAPSSFFHEYDLLHHHGSFLFWHSLPCFWQALPCKLTSHMHTVRCHSVLPWKYHAPTRPGLIQTGASGTWCLQVPPARSFFSSADQPMKQCLAHRRLHRTSKVLAILLGFWKLRNFLRPISASMKEAKAKREQRENKERTPYYSLAPRLTVKKRTKKEQRENSHSELDSQAQCKERAKREERENKERTKRESHTILSHPACP